MLAAGIPQETVSLKAEKSVAGPVRILVVDDDSDLRDSVCETLCDFGFDATAAPGGEQAISACQKETINLVILDVFMPDKDGLETLMELRRTAPHAKIITMSGRGEYRGMDVLRWARKLGAEAVLAKPFTPQELFWVVDGVIRNKEPLKRSENNSLPAGR